MVDLVSTMVLCCALLWKLVSKAYACIRLHYVVTAPSSNLATFWKSVDVYARCLELKCALTADSIRKFGA